MWDFSGKWKGVEIINSADCGVSNKESNLSGEFVTNGCEVTVQFEEITYKGHLGDNKIFWNGFSRQTPLGTITIEDFTSTIDGNKLSHEMVWTDTGSCKGTTTVKGTRKVD